MGRDEVKVEAEIGRDVGHMLTRPCLLLEDGAQ